MKKSKKIEVRLSFEEKEALSGLAKQEGKSVSGLIRGLIENYVSLNAGRPVITPAWGKFAAIAVVGALVGHLGTYAFVQGHNTAHAAERVQINTVRIEIDGYGLDIPINLIDKVQHDFQVTTKKDIMELSLRVTQEPKALTRVFVDICAQRENQCVAIGNSSLIIHPNNIVSSSNVGANGEEIEIHSFPPLKQREEK